MKPLVWIWLGSDDFIASDFSINNNASSYLSCLHKFQLLLKLKQYVDAIKWFDKALAIDPNHKDSIKDRQIALDAAKLDK